MRLGELLNKDLILHDLSAGTKPLVLAELVAAASKAYPAIDADAAVQVLLEREKLGTTGIGSGIAIPHGKIECLDRIVLVVGRSKEGVDFEALDLTPCNIFFLVLAPEQGAGQHLKVLAHVSRLLKDEGFRKSFMEAEDAETLWRLVKGA